MVKKGVIIAICSSTLLIGIILYFIFKRARNQLKRYKFNYKYSFAYKNPIVYSIMYHDFKQLEHIFMNFRNHIDLDKKYYYNKTLIELAETQNNQDIINFLKTEKITYLKEPCYEGEITNSQTSLFRKKVKFREPFEGTYNIDDCTTCLENCGLVSGRYNIINNESDIIERLRIVIT